ncbi:alkaline phosphatase family protein [Kitasatospora indigofera]|uniref:alkaline phosphatase family protein n=1 Tax=Kitasatospora indigofera TaxID=67307 RepID=UPI00369BD927
MSATGRTPAVRRQDTVRYATHGSMAGPVGDAAAADQAHDPAAAPEGTPNMTTPRTPRVLVVGIDGVRHDLLSEVAMPRLAEVAGAGFLVPVEVDADTPTMSGPCWATIVTGVTAAKHGVWGNHLAGNRLDVFPDFATRLAKLDGRRTFVAAGWEPLMLAMSGGPLFRAPGRSSYVAPAADTPEAWEEVDEEVTREAVHVLTTADPEASFVYLGAVDETAHFLGCGSRYRAAMRTADERLGRLLDAVRSRPGHRQEAWTVIVVTDHGHVDTGGHGGTTPEERTAWVACAGPDIPAAPPAGVIRHVDVAAQVYASLGRPADPHWTLDGRPFPVARLAPAAGPDATARVPATVGPS